MYKYYQQTVDDLMVYYISGGNYVANFVHGEPKMH